jgi:outer membrane protein assembly factor BamB
MGVGRIALVLLLVSARVAARAEDWPQFRGPTGQGHSSERGLPIEWGDSRNVLWKTPVPGRGWSSPVIAGGRVWLTTSVIDRGARGARGVREARGASLRAVAFDVDTGRELVNVEVFRLRNGDLANPKNSHASPTPIVEADRVYVHFGAEGTAALTTAGEILWKTRLPYESQHGSGGSPALYGDLLIVSCDGSDQAFVAALDTRTGKVRWRTSRRQPADQAYSTPLVIRVGGRDQVVSVGAHHAAAGIVFIATGFQQPSLLAVRADGTGDVTRSHVAWTLRRGAPLTPSPLLVGDELYLVNDAGIASCLDAATGGTRWVERLGGEYSASPVFADGRIYFQSEDGVTTVIAPGRAFHRLATNTLDGRTLASIAVSAGSIFIRSDSHLYRIGVRAPV